MAEKQHSPLHDITLRNDAGVEIRFHGRLFSESSFFDEEQGLLTRMKLFGTNDGRLIYSVVSGSSTSKSRRVYVLRREDDLWHIHNGTYTITLQEATLLETVFELCGIGAGQTDSLRQSVEENLNAANC